MQITRLLAVLDDQDAIETFRLQGIEISVTASLSEAWEMARSARYEAVVIDMDFCSAGDYRQRCEESGRLPLPVIAFSRENDESFVLSLLHAQFFGLIEKPLNWEKLARLLQAAEELQGQASSMEITSATPAWIEVSIPAHTAHITRFNSFLEQLLKRVLPKESAKVFMAFRELVQNAVEHGSSFCPEKRIFIRYLKSRRFVLFQIEDQGDGFDRSSLPHAATGIDKNSALEAIRYRKRSGMRPGGLGICYALGAGDELIYNQKGNSVIFLKYLDG